MASKILTECGRSGGALRDEVGGGPHPGPSAVGPALVLDVHIRLTSIAVSASTVDVTEVTVQDVQRAVHVLQRSGVHSVRRLSQTGQQRRQRRTRATHVVDSAVGAVML